MGQVYELNLKPQIIKQKIFNKLHIIEDTETYKNADGEFEGLREIIRDKMKLTTLYTIVDPFNLCNKELDDCEKYALCFISSKDDISNIVDSMLSAGDYLKGYLLNEIATEVLFNLSNEMNKIIKDESKKLGYQLSKRYAPGDGLMDMKHQKTIFDVLKRECNIDAHLTQKNMIIPQKSLLYLYGLSICSTDTSDCNACFECGNLNCRYRDVE